MSVNKSRIRRQLDANTGVTLRAWNSAAITSSTTGTGLKLSTQTIPYWGSGDVQYGHLTAVVDVQAINSGAADTVVQIIADIASNMTTSPIVVAETTVSNVGMVDLDIDTYAIANQLSIPAGGSAYIAIKVVPPGGSVTIASWLAQSEPT